MALDKPTVEERLDVQELFARYCWALNTGDTDGYLACFAEDGWVEHFPPTRHQGYAALRLMLDQVWYGRPHSFMGRQHHPSNFLIGRSGQGLDVKAYWSVIRLEQSNNSCHAFLQGHWEADCRRGEDGAWRFASLTIRHWLRHEMPWVGDPKARLVRPSDAYKGPGEF